MEEKRVDVNAAVGMGEVILAACHPDCITTIKHWITIIRARFEEVSPPGFVPGWGSEVVVDTTTKDGHRCPWCWFLPWFPALG